MLGIASPEHRGGRERPPVLETAIAEHGEAWKGATVLGNVSPEHRGGKERGAVLRAALAEHEEVRERAAVLETAIAEHGRDGKGPPYKRRPLGGKQGSGRTRGHGEKQKLRAN